MPIVVRAPSGGGIHGGPFHSQNPEAWFFHMPGLKVVTPATAYDAKGLIKSAIRDNDPVLFFEHKALYRRIKEDLPEEEYTVPIGKARVVREGNDLTIITYGAMVYVALEAADELAEEGASVEVVDLRTLLPLDEATDSGEREEDLEGASCCTRTRSPAASAARSWRASPRRPSNTWMARCVRITAPDTPVPFSPPLEEAFLPKAAKVIEKARWLHRY